MMAWNLLGKWLMMEIIQHSGSILKAPRMQMRPTTITIRAPR
jgi:hypothetical protein